MSDRALQSGRMRSPFLEEYARVDAVEVDGRGGRSSPFTDGTTFDGDGDGELGISAVDSSAEPFQSTYDKQSDWSEGIEDGEAASLGLEDFGDVLADDEATEPQNEDWTDQDPFEEEEAGFDPDADPEDWSDEEIVEDPEDWRDGERETPVASHDQAMDHEFAPGSLREKVSWYQAFLRHVLGRKDVPLNGKHNDPATLSRMREFQEHYGLKKVNGYLTVESNGALTEIALHWLYSLRLPTRPFGSSWGKGIRKVIEQFQRDYGLGVDGKVGAQTRGKMFRLMTGRDGLILKNYHPHLRRDEIASSEVGELSMGDLEEADDVDFEEELYRGIVNNDDRRRVTDTLPIPHRWMCRINGPDGAGSGVLISPSHILTAAHVVYERRTDKYGKVRLGAVAGWAKASPGYNNAPRRRRVYVKDPFGTYDVDIGDSLIPQEYKDAVAQKEDANGDTLDKGTWDFAVLKLREPVGTLVRRPEKLRLRKGTIDVRPRRIGYWLERNLIDVVTDDGETPQEILHRKKWDQLAGKTVYTEGYPGDLKGLYATNDKMRAPFPFAYHPASVRKFQHELDTVSGQSGSPIWMKRNSSVRSLIGVLHSIHYRELDGAIRRLVREKNYAMAITPKIVDMICKHFDDTFKPRKVNGKIVGLGLRT